MDIDFDHPYTIVPGLAAPGPAPVRCGARAERLSGGDALTTAGGVTYRLRGGRRGRDQSATVARAHTDADSHAGHPGNATGDRDRGAATFGRSAPHGHRGLHRDGVNITYGAVRADHCPPAT